MDTYLEYLVQSAENDEAAVTIFKARRARTELNRMTARIAALEAENKKLREALRKYHKEHNDNYVDLQDEFMDMPDKQCDCDWCKEARALLEAKP